MANSSSDVSESVREFISDIITKNNLNPTSDVTYHPGSSAGDGYLSRSHAITINVENGDPWELFVKEGLHITPNTAILRLEECYANEILFYDNIYPAYLKFVNEKGAKNCLSYVPKCYGTSSTNIIGLENLKSKGFEIFDNSKMMNNEHIELVLKTMAKLHAISFAFKDQKGAEYEILVGKTTNVKELQVNEHLDVTRKVWVDEFIASLDPMEDKNILIKLDNLGDRLNHYYRESVGLKSEYSILIHGDCWSNNIMFLYEVRFRYMLLIYFTLFFF